eukprot:3648975-Lingulodinium_polyedra.AAC.1
MPPDVARSAALGVPSSVARRDRSGLFARWRRHCRALKLGGRDGVLVGDVRPALGARMGQG